MSNIFKKKHSIENNDDNRISICKILDNYMNKMMSSLDEVINYESVIKLDDNAVKVSLLSGYSRELSQYDSLDQILRNLLSLSSDDLRQEYLDMFNNKRFLNNIKSRIDTLNLLFAKTKSIRKEIDDCVNYFKKQMVASKSEDTNSL